MMQPTAMHPTAMQRRGTCRTRLHPTAMQRRGMYPTGGRRYGVTCDMAEGSHG